MKYLHEDIEIILEWTENDIPVLIIENKVSFNNVILDFYAQIDENSDGKSKLLDDKDNDLMKKSKLILEPFSLTTSNKDVSNYINDYLLDKMKETYTDLDKMLKPIYSFIREVYFDMPVEIDVGEIFNQKSLAKVFPIKIYDDSESIIEKIINYIKVMTEFDLASIFIFVNLKQYLSFDEYSNFSNFIRNHKIAVLLIERSNDMKLAEEKYLIVDEDLCVID